MKTYHLEIIRTVRTTVVVKADSAAEAHRYVESYGVVEAISDLEMVDEDTHAKIGKIIKCTTHSG